MLAQLRSNTLSGKLVEGEEEEESEEEEGIDDAESLTEDSARLSATASTDSLLDNFEDEKSEQQKHHIATTSSPAVDSSSSQQAPQLPPSRTRKEKRLRRLNHALQTSYSTKLENVYRQWNRELRKSSTMLTNTITLTQDISYHVKGASEDLSALPDRLQQLESWPLMYITRNTE